LQAYDVVLHGDHLYINDAGGIHKLRKDNGKTVWHTNFGSSGTAPIAYGYGHVYAPHSGAMRILNALSGEIVHIMSPPYGSYFWKVTAAEGRIFAQSNSHLYAFAPWGHEDALELNDWQDAGR
jgi:outer membrane protein assembly factor BamB